MHLQDIFFQNHPNPPPPEVKWLAPNRIESVSANFVKTLEKRVKIYLTTRPHAITYTNSFQCYMEI